MRARQIIYHHYNDYTTKQLEKMIKVKHAEGDSFGARILQARLNRWLTAATSDIVNRQVQRSFEDKVKDNENSGGRERFTLRDLNRLRKEKLALTREEAGRLQDIEAMYRKPYTAK